MKDLARKIDSMRQFGYVLLTPKEAKRVAIELRRVERMKKQLDLAPAAAIAKFFAAQKPARHKDSF